MTSNELEVNQPLRRPRVLIIEDDKTAAEHHKHLLEDRGCECVVLVCDHGRDFEAELSRMYPSDQLVREEYKFQGTLLDVIFKTSGSIKETEGGRDLYLYMRSSSNPCILDQLGIVLVVSQHRKPTQAFKDIGEEERHKLRFCTKYHSKFLAEALNKFVADL